VFTEASRNLARWISRHPANRISAVDTQERNSVAVLDFENVAEAHREGNDLTVLDSESVLRIELESSGLEIICVNVAGNESCAKNLARNDINENKFYSNNDILPDLADDNNETFLDQNPQELHGTTMN
jgi:hypothetical protein